MQLLKQNHVKYGLIMTGVTGACLILMELTGQAFDNKSPLQVIFMFIAPALVWFLGMRERKRALKGKLSYKEGLKEGFKISLVYAIVSPFVFLLYYQLASGSDALNYAKEAYGLTSASTAMVIAVDMVAQFVAAIIFGTLYAAIIAIFLRTKSK